MGDGALVEFASAVDAVTCAIEIQRQLRERDASGSDADPIRFRIGINVGDIIIEGDDILGDGVNVAARIEGIAEPGGISISEDAWRQVQGKVAVNFVDAGEQSLKNIARPVRVYRLELGPKPTSASEAPRPTPAPPDKPSIAVLAFNNMSGDPEQEYFSDGISEDIITDLSKLSELRVIARNSTFTYKGKAVDVKQVGRDLGVRYVLEGSVRKAGNRVRVTGQLIDAASGEHIWADRFDRDLTDIFAVQDELTQEIISALRIKLTPEQKDRLARKNTIDEEAYDLFLRAREHTWHATRTGSIEARNLLGRAVTINPDFAAAHAVIAATHLNDYANGWAEIPEQSLQTGFRNCGAGGSVGRRRASSPRGSCYRPVFSSGSRPGSCRGAALPRTGAELSRRTCADRSYSDVQRRPCVGDQNDRRLHAARSALSGPRTPFSGRGAMFPWASSTKPSQPSHSALSATPFQKRPMLCLHSATASSVGLLTLGQPGRR